MTRIWTIGHSCHPVSRFLELLQAFKLSWVADVRRVPASRRHPQFSRPALEQSLKAAGLRYRHFAALGGRRTPQPDSVNTAIADPGLRGYADWTAAADCRRALALLCELAQEAPTVVMCAEADPARCHRQLLADLLVLRGFAVVHILADGRTRLHHVHDAVRVGPDGVVIWPERQAGLFA